MMENPVRSPMVPPIADNMSTNFAALSFVILSNVGVWKKILTNLRLFFHWKSKYCLRVKLWIISQYSLMVTIVSYRVFSYFLVFVVLSKYWKQNIQIAWRIRSCKACDNKPRARFQAVKIINLNILYTFKFSWRAKRSLRQANYFSIVKV